jgi:hypothetical protein
LGSTEQGDQDIPTCDDAWEQSSRSGTFVLESMIEAHLLSVQAARNGDLSKWITEMLEASYSDIEKRLVDRAQPSLNDRIQS